MKNRTLSLSVFPIVIFMFMLICVVCINHIVANGNGEDYSHYYDCADEELEVSELQAQLDAAVKKVRDHEMHIAGLIFHTKQGQGDQNDPLGLKYKKAKKKYIELTEAANAIHDKLKTAEGVLAMCKPPCGHYYPPYDSTGHNWIEYNCGEHGRYECKPAESGHDKILRDCGHKWADCEGEEVAEAHEERQYVCGSHSYFMCNKPSTKIYLSHDFTDKDCGHRRPKCTPGNHAKQKRGCGHNAWNCQPVGNHRIEMCPVRSLDGNGICMHGWWKCKHIGIPSHKHIFINENEI